MPQRLDQPNPARIAVLITCHNRREITLACLHHLYQQNSVFQVYLVDDGSCDRTAEAVRSAYPAVHLLQGDGTLYWVGGMRLAFATAMEVGYDYYLWLNDDTLLQPHALSQLLAVHAALVQQNKADAIVVGSARDRQTGTPTYGGAVRSKVWYSNKFEFLESTSEMQPCDTVFGNCVLIPDSVAQKVGNLDAAFIHTLGDLDYGLRARQLGCSIWVAPGYVATCSKNSVVGSWADTQLPLWQRLQKATQVKGFPITPWTIFNQRHSGLFWVFYWFLPYLRAIVGYRHLEASPTFCADGTQESL